MLSRAECFKVLGLDESGGPNAIKKAYRRLAFELHPDLHPDLPDASQHFQRLNEAYVLLMQEYANTSFAAGSRPHSFQGERRAADEYASTTDEKIRTDARKAYEKAKKAAGSSSAWGDGQRAGFPGDARAEAEKSAESGAAGAKSAAGQSGEGNARSGYAHRASNREEILRDLLNDPFARRVFEDIYSHVRHNSGKGAKDAGNFPPPPPKKISKKALATPAHKSPLLAVGKKFYRLAGGIKDWLRKQIDEEQNMFLPGEALLPGARIRLQVRHGFSGTKKTVEFTLPPEFAPGKPIRLKGLGRHVGNLQGDLYLRVFNEETAEAAEEPEA
jgi:molecular chaperone DnaJ